MARYIDQQLVKTYLNLGKTIEVFLGRKNIDKTILSYLELIKTTNSKVQVTIIESYDEGNLNWLDIYEFSHINEDDEFEKIEFDNIENAIEGIKAKFQLNEVKFVTQGMIQVDYEDLLKLEGRN
jgi:hypothetical protein